MQLHMLKLQACSLNTLLSIISSPALQKSCYYSSVFSFPLKNEQANNKTIHWKLTFQHFSLCFFTVISTNHQASAKHAVMAIIKAVLICEPKKRTVASRNDPRSHFWKPLYLSHNKECASHFERKYENKFYLCYLSSTGLKTTLTDRLLRTFNVKGSREISHGIAECPST